ncbi:MAG: hypothetical protein OXG71_00835 [Rhodospirillales bacterium]|nr:hypothetical protein [Rhodospirillales bacterium]
MIGIAIERRIEVNYINGFGVHPAHDRLIAGRFRGLPRTGVVGN